MGRPEYSGRPIFFPVHLTGTAQPLNVSVGGFRGVSSNILTGTFDNNTLTMSGSYQEETGTTSPTHVLVATGANRMEGVETWNFTDATGTCPNSKSSVTATRQ